MTGLEEKVRSTCEEFADDGLMFLKVLVLGYLGGPGNGTVKQL